MFGKMKRIFALLLAVVLVCALLPAGAVQAVEQELPKELTQADYAQADLVFDRIDAMESAPAKKNASQQELTQAAMEIVMASDSYLEGSLELNGESFTWWTDNGVRCIYSPRMQKIQKKTTPEKGENIIVNEPAATKGGSPASNQVYLIGPYYGYDSDFTDQYKNEAKRVATALGDTDGYTLYSGKSATVDKVADAISNGAVVFFDSHGTTDYENGYDYVTGATSSYLCLTSTTGLTDEDYDDGALYYSDGICINGATIANHMKKNSPSGFLWMALCLGMATDTMCEPLRAKGVEVVYGYSQSVTFAGDYLYEETFWEEMIAGETVASSIATMKKTWGNWDWSVQIAEYYGYDDGFTNISEVRKEYFAFPVVVSDEDVFPGQRKGSFYGADSLQTVKSTYTLFTQYDVTAKSNNAAWGSVSASGNTITATPAAGYFAQSATVLSGNATVSQNGNSFFVAAESDCIVQINFAAKTSVSVNFSGANVAGQTGYAGDAMTLPVAEAPEGYKFLGWMTAPLSSDTTEKPAFYTDSFTPTGNTTLYALYSYVDATSGGGTGDYVKVTESRDDWSGEYLIVNEATGRVFDGSRDTLEAVSNYQKVTIRNNTISAEEADAYRFLIAPYGNGYSIQSAGGKYISGTAAQNKLNEGTSPQVNTITIDAAGNADIVSNTSHLRYNATSGQDRFRYFKSTTYSNQKEIALYVKDGSAGTTYYTTNITQCNHTNVVVDAAVAATCQKTGLTEGSHCADCGTVLVAQAETAIRACSFRAIVTPPTCTEQGYATYTCIWCGEVDEVTDYVDALGHSYGDNGVCSACGANKELLAGWNLILTDRIGMSFHLNLTAEEAAKTQVRFTVNGAASTADAQIKDGKYVYTLSLAAAQMTEKVNVEILSDGEVVQTGEYSVRQYAETILEGNYNDKTKALVKAMLNYGAEAQRYFRYNTNNLADAGYVQESFTAVPAYAAKYPVSGSVSGISYYGASLLFHSNVAVRFYFTGDVSGLTFTAGGKTLTSAKKGDKYYVQVSEILPQDMDKAVVLTVSDGADTMTVSYSPMDYITNQSAGGDAGLKTLLLKMYNYHLAAKDYTN